MSCQNSAIMKGAKSGWPEAMRFLLLSGAELADDHLTPHAVRAGRAVGGVGGRGVSWRASAPLSGAARPLGHTEFALVARVEQVEQPARVVTEQQPCDVSHPATSSSS
jgi:hypothetical protein